MESGGFFRAVLLYPLFLLITAFGCTRPGQEINWTEAVPLSTGEQLVVRRGEIRRWVAEPFQPGGWLFSEAWIEGNLPGAGPFRWETSLRPWLLDRATDGTWYLIGMRAGSRSANEYGLYHPRDDGPLFVPYRFREGAWHRVLADDLPTSFVTPNLLVFGEQVFERSEPYQPLREVQQRAPDATTARVFLDTPLKRELNRRLSGDASRFFSLSRQKVDRGERYGLACRSAFACCGACETNGGTCESIAWFPKRGLTQQCVLRVGCGTACSEKGGRCEIAMRMAFDKRMGRSPIQRSPGS